MNLQDSVTENPAEAEAAREIATSSDDASDNISEGASSLKVCEQEEEQSGEEEVSSVLQLHLIAHIALPYKSLSTCGESWAKIRGYQSIPGNPDVEEVPSSMASLVSWEGLVSSSGPLTTHPPRLEWKPSGYDA